MGKKKLLAVVAVILVLASVFFAWQYFATKQELQQARAQLKQNVFHRNTLEFTKAFVNKVLNARQEVSFDDRLRLENMVRDLNDKQVLDQWNKFVGSQTESDAQEQVKILLSLLLSKI